MTVERSIGRSVLGSSTEAGESRRAAADDARRYAKRTRDFGVPPSTVDPLYAYLTGVTFPVSGAIMLSRLRGVTHVGEYDRLRAYVGGAAAGTVPVGAALYEIRNENSAQAGDALVAFGTDSFSMDLLLFRGATGWSTVNAVGKTAAEISFVKPVSLDPDKEYAIALSVVGTVDGAALGVYPGVRGLSPRLRTVLAAGDGFPEEIRVRDSDVVAAVDAWTIMSVLLSRTRFPGLVMP